MDAESVQPQRSAADTPPPALPCTVCGGGAVIEARIPEVTIYRCPTCDHAFTDAASILHPELYEPEYYLKTHKNWFSNPYLELYEKIHQHVMRSLPQATVLDIGCGNGNFLKYLQQRNEHYEMNGIDLSPNEPAPGITFLQGDALVFSIERQYDVVVSLAVIEHIVDVRLFAARLRQMVKPGGLVVTMTVNDRSVLYEMGRLMHRIGFSMPFQRLYGKHHVNHFNLTSLARLMQSQGLRVERTLRHNVPLAAADFVASTEVARMVLRAGVWGTFCLGTLTGRTYLQTLFCRA